MKSIRVVGITVISGLCLVTTDSGSFGQRFGGRGAAAVAAQGGVAAGPFGGAGAASRIDRTAVGPLGGAATAGAGRGSYTTGNGTTIDYAGAGRAAVGPNGGAAGRGVGGVQVTTPGGQTFTKVGVAQGAVGPNGNAIGGRASVAAVQGPNGAAVTAKHGGVAIGPAGVVAGGARVGAAAGPYGSSGYAARGVAVGHRTAYVAPVALRGQGVYVRKNFVHYNTFHPNWYVAHANAWRAAAWTAAAVWRGAAWAALVSACGYPQQPVLYDYGTTIVYQDNRVYYNGDPVATAEEYTDQAAAIAGRGEQARVSDKEEWTPLGVFGMVKGEDQDANQIFQLAINGDGVLRGNYYDALSDTTLPVYGAVDKRTQRAAWTVGDRKETVYETGIGNLTEPETTMLVHFGKDRTQQWTLIRLEEPQGQK